MLLTRKELRTIAESLKVILPSELEKELLYTYGNPVTDDDGYVFEYTEQDICEQVRKRLHPYMKNL